MFNSYDLNQFGAELRKLRNRSKVTQKMVSDTTHIHIDTLRRIENGLCIPKYETIEVLSHYYKTDLFLLLNQTRGDYTLNLLYEEIDQIIVQHKIENITKISKKLETLLSQTDISSNLIDTSELELLKTFICALPLLYSNKSADYRKANSLLLSTLFGSEVSVQAYLLEDMNFNLLESRLLLMLGLIKIRLRDYEQSLTILQFLANYFNENALYSSHSIKLLLKIYLNISYCFHYLDDNENAKRFAEEGIAFAISNDSLYCLFYLYFRKGIAELLLHTDDYHDSLKNGVLLLRLQNDATLYSEYRSIFLEKYHIDLDNY